MDRLSRIQALLVDDDPMILALLSAFLESKGYSVTRADNGQAALKRIAQGGINLVITDWMMPFMDGMELCRAIRKKQHANYIYLIMLTSNNEEDSLVAAMQAGVDDFLGKPFSPAELGARLYAAERVLALEAGLEKRNRDLAEAYDQLSRELELAKAMQLAVLPERADFGRICFDWIFEASSYVGGDILDYFRIDDNHLCFYVIDVSGHGVSAAMMAFSAQNYLLSSSQQIAKTIARQGGDIGSVAEIMVAKHNHHFMQMKETSLYLTMIYGLVDTATGLVALVQAGHPPPLYVDPAGVVTPIGDGGLPIGILANATYEAHLLQLIPGSRLFLYSDGVTECSDTSGRLFGQQRLESILGRQNGLSLTTTGAEVRQALFEWKGSLGAFDDDITLLSLEYR
jgi:sigma-B regulation protein RsbU (phosphoserine phosphatase)